MRRDESMTKFDLGQLKDLNKEIELLQRQIADAPNKANKVFGTVKGSSPKLPFQERGIRVSWIDWADYDRKVTGLRKKLQHRVDELMTKVVEINTFIEGVPDAEVRMILQLKYINGMSFEEIGPELGMSERTVRRKFRKWWESC